MRQDYLKSMVGVTIPRVELLRYTDFGTPLLDFLCRSVWNDSEVEPFQLNEEVRSRYPSIRVRREIADGSIAGAGGLRKEVEGVSGLFRCR